MKEYEQEINNIIFSYLDFDENLINELLAKHIITKCTDFDEIDLKCFENMRVKIMYYAHEQSNTIEHNVKYFFHEKFYADYIGDNVSVCDNDGNISYIISAYGKLIFVNDFYKFVHNVSKYENFYNKHNIYIYT